MTTQAQNILGMVVLIGYIVTMIALYYSQNTILSLICFILLYVTPFILIVLGFFILDNPILIGLAFLLIVTYMFVSRF